MFRFPTMKHIFDYDKKDRGNSMISESDDSMKYLFNSLFTINIDVVLAEVLILKVPDAILNRVSGTSEEESHIIFEKFQHTLYPKAKSETPISLTFRLG